VKLPSHFDDSGAQFAWDSTTLSTAFECERKYYFQYIEHFVDATRSVHLIFGGHYAKAVERYHKALALGASHDEAVYSVVRDAMIDTWIHNLNEDGSRRPGTGHAELFLSTSKTRENLIRTIVWYLEEYKNSEVKTLIKSDGTPAVEYSFKLPVDNDIIFCGHLDRVIEFADANFVQDQKTTGSTVTPNSFAAYDMAVQMSMYTWAGKAIFATPIKGVMIDIAQVASGFSRFLRGFTYRSDEYLTEWYGQVQAKIEVIRRKTQHYQDTGDSSVFQPNYTACTNYGGCEFRDVCSKAPQFRAQFLRSNFERRRPWNPLESR
jgi:hypothetical protein